jgi:hypothetical protein
MLIDKLECADVTRSRETGRCQFIDMPGSVVAQLQGGPGAGQHCKNRYNAADQEAFASRVLVAGLHGR